MLKVKYKLVSYYAQYLSKDLAKELNISQPEAYELLMREVTKGMKNMRTYIMAGFLWVLREAAGRVQRSYEK